MILTGLDGFSQRRNVLMDTHESWLQKEEELEREIEYEF
jgi:hypothetical protein